MIPLFTSHDLRTVFFLNVFAILVAALCGAQVGLSPFRWRRIAGATSGLFLGVLSIVPVMFLSLILLRHLFVSVDLPIVKEFAGVIWIALFFLVTSSVSYLLGTLGRPSQESLTVTVDPQTMMETLDRNADEIKQVVFDMLRLCGTDVSGAFDLWMVRQTGILSEAQVSRIADILRMRTRLEHSRSVLHADLQLWAERSGELLVELSEQRALIREPVTTHLEGGFPPLKNRNPYAPPRSDTV